MSVWKVKKEIPDKIEDPAVVAHALAAWDVGGITGLSLVSVTSAVWMLPHALDASVAEPLVASAKYLSVPVLIGLPLGMSWPRMGFVIRGVFLLELIATLFRLGWLYSVWPGRLCSNYLLEDQQQLGRDMLIVGATLCIWMGWKLIWGRFTSLPDHDTSPLRKC